MATYQFGRYVGDKKKDVMVYTGVSCASQLPLVKLRVDQGEYSVELECNADQYSSVYTLKPNHVRDYSQAVPTLNLGRTGLDKALIRLERTETTARPILMGSHPFNFTDEYAEMLQCLLGDQT